MCIAVSFNNFPYELRTHLWHYIGFPISSSTDFKYFTISLRIRQAPVFFLFHSSSSAFCQHEGMFCNSPRTCTAVSSAARVCNHRNNCFVLRARCKLIWPAFQEYQPRVRLRKTAMETSRRETTKRITFVGYLAALDLKNRDLYFDIR